MSMNRTATRIAVGIGVCIAVLGLAMALISVLDVSKELLVDDATETSTRHDCGPSAIERIVRGGLPNGPFLDKEEKERIRSLIKSACYWEGGNFNGTIFFCSLQCDDEISCWQVLEALVHANRGDFSATINPTYEDFYWGPRKYWPNTIGSDWTPRDVREGALYERVVYSLGSVTNQIHDRVPKSYSCYLVDSARYRVFFQSESGGPQLTEISIDGAK